MPWLFLLPFAPWLSQTFEPELTVLALATQAELTREPVDKQEALLGAAAVVASETRQTHEASIMVPVQTNRERGGILRDALLQLRRVRLMGFEMTPHCFDTRATWREAIPNVLRHFRALLLSRQLEPIQSALYRLLLVCFMAPYACMLLESPHLPNHLLERA